MADNSNNNTPQQTSGNVLDEVVRAARNLEEARKREVDLAAAMLGSARDLSTELKEQFNIRTRITAEQKTALDISREIERSASESNFQLITSGDLNKQIVRDRKNLYKTEVEIAIMLDKQGDQAEKVLDEAKKLAAQRKKIQDLEKERVNFEKRALTASAQVKGGLRAQAAIRERLKNAALEEYGILTKTASEDAVVLALLLAQKDQATDINEIREQGKEKQKEFNSALGITGALLDNLNKVGVRAFGGIGLNLAAFGVELEGAKDAADKTAASLTFTKAGKGISTFKRQVKVIEAALPGIRKAALAAFSDPLTIATTLLVKLGGSLKQSFFELDKSVTTVARIVGNTNAVELARSLKTANKQLVTVKDGMKIVAALSEQTQLNITATFSPETISQAAELVNYYGLSEKEAASLAQLTALNGIELNKNKEQLFKSVNNFNKLNRTAVNGGAVLRGVANTSNAVRLSLGGSVDELVKAQAQASRLGLDLEKLEAIADSLLDFESSIEAELQAQLLTGKNINLSKARELALSNDLAGIGQEIFNNAADLREFAEMDRIDQKAYAQALGLSREEMAKMVFERGKALKLSDQDLQKATQLSDEEYRRMEIQVAFQTSMNKLLEAITPIISGIASMSKLLVTSVATLGTMYTLLKGIQITQGIITGLKAAEAFNTNRAAVAERLLNAERLKGVGRLAAQATAWAFMNPGKAILGAAAAVSIGALIYSKMKDGMVGPGGEPLLSTEKGAIQFDKDDYIIAASDPFKSNPGVGGDGRAVEVLSRKLDTLIEAVRTRGNVYLDNRVVGVVSERQVIGATNYT